MIPATAPAARLGRTRLGAAGGLAPTASNTSNEDVLLGSAPRFGIPVARALQTPSQHAGPGAVPVFDCDVPGARDYPPREPECFGVDRLVRVDPLGTIWVVVAGHNDGALSRGAGDGRFVDADRKKRAVGSGEGGWTGWRDQHYTIDPLFDRDLRGGQQPQGDAAAVRHDDALPDPQLGKLTVQDGERLVQCR